MNKIQYLGMAWYRREDYEALRSVFADSHVLPDTYDQWLKLANDALDGFRRKGITVEKVYIDPETFPDWCQSRDLYVDAKARVRFANEFVARKYLNKDL